MFDFSGKDQTPQEIDQVVSLRGVLGAAVPFCWIYCAGGSFTLAR